MNIDAKIRGPDSFTCYYFRSEFASSAHWNESTFLTYILNINTIYIIYKNNSISTQHIKKINHQYIPLKKWKKTNKKQLK